MTIYLLLLLQPRRVFALFLLRVDVDQLAGLVDVDEGILVGGFLALLQLVFAVDVVVFFFFLISVVLVVGRSGMYAFMARATNRGLF